MSENVAYTEPLRDIPDSSSEENLAAIEERIRETRHQISTTLDRIQERLSMRYAWEQLRERFSASGRDGLRSTQELALCNPLPTAMLGGLALWGIGSGVSKLLDGTARYPRGDRQAEHERDDWDSATARPIHPATSRAFEEPEARGTEFKGSELEEPIVFGEEELYIDFPLEQEERWSDLPDHFTSNRRGARGSRRSGFDRFGEFYGEADVPRDLDRSQLETERRPAGRWRRAAHRVTESMAQSGERMMEAKDRIMESTTHAKDRMKESAAHASERAKEGFNATRRRASRSYRRASVKMRRGMNEQPLLVGGLAFLAGAAIGALLPETRAEEEWMGEARERLATRARDFGEEIRDAGSRVAQVARDEVGQGLPRDGEEAGERVKRVVDTAREATKEIGREQSH